MEFEEWHERSFFIELKPRAEFASLFVDCPPHDKKEELKKEEDKEDSGQVNQNCSDVVRVGEHWVVLEETNDTSVDTPTSFRARIDELSLSPNSVCSPTWTDNHRLFMCKVHAEASSLPLVPKTFNRLARDVCATTELEEYVESVQGGPLMIECDECGAKLVDKKAGECCIGFLPSDGFLETSPGGDFYCRDSCGAACDPYRHSHHRDNVDTKECHDEWKPKKDKALLAHTTTVLHRDTIESDGIVVEDKVVRCSACTQPLGSLVKNDTSFVSLHHAVIRVFTNQSKSFLDTRFSNISQFFALLVLAQCESQSSLKLVIRSLDKTPHVLVWLLDSYVVLTAGDLVNEKSSGHSFKPFPALKMLYKVFDATTAASDPRANGEDASVGLVDVPLGCCVKLVECLLHSSHALPPACRSVGQFYVGFLKIAESI